MKLTNIDSAVTLIEDYIKLKELLEITEGEKINIKIFINNKTSGRSRAFSTDSPAFKLAFLVLLKGIKEKQERMIEDL